MGGKIFIARRTTVDIRGDTQNDSVIGRRDSQLLYGEAFQVERRQGAWLKGVSVLDGYEGFVRAEDMTPLQSMPTHVVKAVLTQLYPAPDFKTRPLMTLSFLSHIALRDETPQNGFLPTTEGYWIPGGHVRPIQEAGADWTTLALMFLGLPYLYGGRSALGIDCSGLVQIALQACGVSCPRDSDQQMAISKAAAQADLRRGDLVFFKGHVGIMTDGSSILNATARTMDVRIETLSSLQTHYGDILAIRRL